MKHSRRYEHDWFCGGWEIRVRAIIDERESVFWEASRASVLLGFCDSDMNDQTTEMLKEAFPGYDFVAINSGNSRSEIRLL